MATAFERDHGPRLAHLKITSPVRYPDAMTSFREIVVRRIAERAQAFPQLDPTPLDLPASSPGAVDPRDRGLAHAIDQAVARRWLTLSTVLQSRLLRPWDQVEPALQAVLLAGAAQLLLLERIPDHAAVDESVEMARRIVRPGAAGFTNAVLRKVADLRREIATAHDPQRRDELPIGDGRAWRLTEAVFAENIHRRLAQTTSHPEALIRRWRRTLSEAAAAEVAQHDLIQPPIIVAGLPDAGRSALTEHEEPGFQVFNGSMDELEELLREHATARVQDPTSAQPVLSTQGMPLRLIIDACAGLGTKTKQLAALHPDARIIASDLDERRHRVLRQTFAGSSQVTVKRFDELEAHRGEADLLLLDVPCSNTGVLARRVEARYRVTSAALKSLADLQRSIVATALPLRGPTGRLLYATCSIEPEENEEQIKWLAALHRMQTISSASRLPQGQPGDAPSRYRDGGFYAVLERR